MPAKRRRVVSATASQSTDGAADGQQRKRLQPSLPAAFAQLSSAVARVCVLPYLQLPELFELSHVSAAFTAVSQQAAVDWMQRAFASTAQRLSLLVQQAAEKKLQRRLQRQEQLGSGAIDIAPEPAAAAAFSFTLSDARFVHSEMQWWGVAGSPSARRLRESEIFEHFKDFPASRGRALHRGGRRSVPSCSLHDVLDALFVRYQHADAYSQWRKRKIALQREKEQRYPDSLAAGSEDDRTERGWRSSSSSSGGSLLLLLPDAVIGSAVLGFLEFSEVMEMRAVCSSLKPESERQAVRWMTATFPSALVTIGRQQQAEQEEKDGANRKRKRNKAKEKAAAAAETSQLSAVGSTSGLRLPAAEAASAALSPSFPSSSSSSSSPAVSLLPAASFSVADCAWLRRQLYRAERLKANDGWRRDVRGRARSEPLTLSAQEAAEWYSVSRTELQRCHVHYVRYRLRFRRVHIRWDLLCILRVVLERHGHAARFTAYDTERRRRRLSSGHQAERAARRQAVDAALAAAGLQADWGPESDPALSWFCQQAEFGWWRQLGWVRKWKQPLTHGGPELHRVLLALGMQCAGNCGWGGCQRQAGK